MTTQCTLILEKINVFNTIYLYLQNTQYGQKVSINMCSEAAYDIDCLYHQSTDFCH